MVTNVTIRTMGYFKFIRAASLAWLLLAVLVLLPVSVHAASLYGRDDYGSCTYGTCTKHTVEQTPTGLKVAVNLTDGQVIPLEGYTIIITPLNGAGSSFKQADIYIDGVKVATVTPSADGSAKWPWDPVQYPGQNVEVQVTDTSGNITTFKFTVLIATAPTLVQQSGGVSGGAPLSGDEPKPYFIRLLANFTESTKRAIKNLPAPVVYTFPYLLFVLLLVEIAVLLLQTKRELRELATARRLADEEQEIAGMKQTFMDLVSHYLRTPLTILQGGAEGLGRDRVDASTITSLQTTTKQLHDTIESLIATTTQSSAMVIAGTPTAAQSRRFAAAAGQVALWLPVALVGVVAFGFVYLANHVTSFTTNTVGVLTQVIIYSILALVLYQVARRRHLHRHDAAAAQKILDDQRAVQKLRDDVITQTAAKLQSQVGSLSTFIAAIPPTATNAKFVQRGYDQLRTVTSKFVIATHLRGARSSEPYAPVTLDAVYARVSKEVLAAAAAKKVSIAIEQDAQFAIQNISLMALVLQTVLDNAVAYSPEQGAVTLSATAQNSQALIRVIDHGSGIAADKQDALFQPFFKAEGAEQFNREGMGFSLYLDKLIMKYLGSDIAVSSQPGAGTTVDMILTKQST